MILERILTAFPPQAWLRAPFSPCSSTETPWPCSPCLPAGTPCSSPAESRSGTGTEPPPAAFATAFEKRVITAFSGYEMGQIERSVGQKLTGTLA